MSLAVAGGSVSVLDGCARAHKNTAYAPWELWNAPHLNGTPLALVAAAVLGTNPHDSQPWLFRVHDVASTSSPTYRAIWAPWIPFCARCIWVLAAR